MKKLLLKIYNGFYRIRLLYVTARLLGGKYFDLPHLHPFTLLGHIFVQKILRINSNVPWPVHFTTRVDGARNIVPGNYAPGIAPGCYLDGTNGIFMGKNVRVAPRVSILSANHGLNDFDEYPKSEPVRIGNNCWLGTNVIILPGVQLGNHVIVAAGAVVTKSFPADNILLAGVPAKVIKQLEPYKTRV